jgi:hypothetical protein
MGQADWISARMPSQRARRASMADSAARVA